MFRPAAVKGCGFTKHRTVRGNQRRRLLLSATRSATGECGTACAEDESSSLFLTSVREQRSVFQAGLCHLIALMGARERAPRVLRSKNREQSGNHEAEENDSLH